MARLFFAFVVFGLLASECFPIPALSRKYGIECASCHVHGAKLNAFGQIFRQRGAAVAGVEEKLRGQPLTVWLSLMAANKTSDRDGFRLIPSRLEIVSLGEWKGG